MISLNRSMKFTHSPLLLGALTCLSLSIGTPAHAANRWVDIVNYTDYVLVRLYASNTGRPYWGSDKLGQYVIEPGESFARNFDDGSGYCMFDIKAVFEDGDVLFDELNVCEEYELAFF